MGTQDFGRYNTAAKINGIRLSATEPFVVATGGTVTLPATTTVGGSSLAVLGTITSTSANAFAVGPGGTTNPSFNVDASTSSAITGVNIKSAASGAGVAVKALGGTNEALTLDGKGSGAVGINTVSTTSGLVTIGNSTSLAGATINGATTVTSASASSFAVGRLGATTPAFLVDSSTSTQVTGLSVTGAATGGTVALAVIQASGNANLTIDAKGSGTIAVGATSTGAVTITPATTVSGALTVGAALKSTTATLTGAGAVGLTTLVTKIATTGVNALTLADGTDGQVKILVMTTDGGDGTLTPTTKTGYSTIVFNDAGDGCVLVFTTTTGWIVAANNGCTIS